MCGGEWDFKGSRGEGKTAAVGLGDCFFLGPAAVEGCAAVLGIGDVVEGCVFGWGEGVLRDLEEVGGGVDVFDVDADAAVTAKRDEDGVGGVSDVEGECGVGE